MNIILIFDSTYGDTFYKGFADELVKNGSNILYINVNNITDLSHIKNEIRNFKGDIAFLFNFVRAKELKKVLPRKKVNFDVDTPENLLDKTFFTNEYNKSDTYYISIQSDYKKILHNTLPKIKSFNKCMYLPSATSLKKENLPYKRNIFICCSNWSYNQYETLSDLNKQELIAYYEKFKKDYFKDTKKFFNHDVDSFLLKWNLAGLERVSYLSELTDLGLEIYGDRWDKLYYNMDVLKCTNNKKITNSSALQIMYNSSKICVNFSHPQAKSSFSFRCMDIMASNSCLLMEDKLEWKDLFAKYLSKDVLDTIIYKDRFDMRQKAIKLLSDEKLRLKCVKELNNAIEQNGRWKHRISKLEEFLGIKLQNLPTEGKCIILSSEDSCLENKNNKAALPKQHKNIFQKLKMKKRYKLFVYSLLLALCQIPLLDMGIRHKHRDKLLQKINKYWR